MAIFTLTTHTTVVIIRRNLNYSKHFNFIDVKTMNPKYCTQKKRTGVRYVVFFFVVADVASMSSSEDAFDMRYWWDFEAFSTKNCKHTIGYVMQCICVCV